MPLLRIGQARRLQLHAQGLLQSRHGKARKSDLVASIGQMRLLQIDTIHVVARSPYLVLHSRLGDYPPAWLDEVLEEGLLAECWAHEACFVPAADYLLHDAWRAERDHHWSHRGAQRMWREHRDEMEALLRHIEQEGPVRASDFEHAERGASGWWEWKPEKRWLEAWFALGELMVLRRERFQRVYDLASRVRARLALPASSSQLSVAALRRQFILDSIRALGVAPARWVADYYRLKPAVTDAELQPMVADGAIQAVAVDGWKEPGYVHRDHLEALGRAMAGGLRATRTVVLSPFDPLVWDRERLRGMFDFDYRLECYTPAPKRRFGYFVLPILHRGVLVGRLDAKAHRREGVFEIRALFFEAGVRPGERLSTELATTIQRLATWHGTPEVRLGQVRPAGFRALLQAALDSA